MVQRTVLVGFAATSVHVCDSHSRMGLKTSFAATIQDKHARKLLRSLSWLNPWVNRNDWLQSLEQCPVQAPRESSRGLFGCGRTTIEQVYSGCSMKVWGKTGCSQEWITIKQCILSNQQQFKTRTSSFPARSKSGGSAARYSELGLYQKEKGYGPNMTWFGFVSNRETALRHRYPQVHPPIPPGRFEALLLLLATNIPALETRGFGPAVDICVL